MRRHSLYHTSVRSVDFVLLFYHTFRSVDFFKSFPLFLTRFDRTSPLSVTFTVYVCVFSNESVVEDVRVSYPSLVIYRLNREGVSVRLRIVLTFKLYKVVQVLFV